MKKTLSLTLSFAVAVLGCISAAAPRARGQEVASTGNSISKIREEYERLLAVERNPETPPEVREMNHNFLQERRTQLRDAIQKRLRALRTYQTSMSGALSDSEGLVVANSIRALERDFAAIAGGALPAAPLSLKPLSPAVPGTTDTFDTAEIKLEITPSSTTTPIQDVEVKVENGGKVLGTAKTVSWETLDFLPTPKAKSINVGLAAGDNVVTVTVTKPANTYEPKKETYKYKAATLTTNVTPPAAAPTPKPKPDVPGIDFIQAGDTSVTVFGAKPSAPVTLHRGATKQTVPADARGYARFTLSPPAAAGDYFEATQKVDEVESDRGSRTTQARFDDTAGGPFGLIIGGTVISQQAQEFQQADPFFGFIAGYSSKMRSLKDKKVKIGNTIYTELEDGTLIDSQGYEVEETATGVTRKKDPATQQEIWVNTRVRKVAREGRGGTWRWNLRFQGIFQSAPRTAQATNTTATNTGTGGTGGQAADPFKFIASRKTFDVETHGWFDFWAKNVFSIGPYLAFGASAVMDKNELQGEPVTPPDTSATGGTGTGGTGTQQVATNSQSANDLKKFYEFGMLSNIYLLSRDRPLYIQSILGYGNYEALNGLYEGFNTKHRFVGKLRVFPLGLRRNFGAQVQGAPMFGVDLNASRGPDHLKFFTGYAISIRGFDIQSDSK